MKFATSASPSLLVFEVPGLIAAGGEDTVTYAFGFKARCLLLAFPAGVIDEDAFPKAAADEDQMVGPSKTFDGIELYEERRFTGCPVWSFVLSDSLQLFGFSFGLPQGV